MNEVWKKALIKPENNILEAIEVIDRQAIKAAFVVTDDWKFEGIVTDGDIRRGLLGGLALQEPVSKVANTTPLTCDPTTAPEAIRRIMEAKQLLHMPIVHEGRLVNVLMLHQLTERPQLDNPVFLMAGGYGSRLQPLTKECPKPLLKIGGKPILETIIENFIEYGFHRFIISTHYLPEMIREHFGNGNRWGVNISYTCETEPLGTGGALGLLPNDLPELPLLMINGDILTKVNFFNLLSYHNNSESVATMCVREHEHQVPYGVVDIENFHVRSMTEKPIYRYYVNAGIYVIDPSIVRQVNGSQVIDMPTLLNQQINKGDVVSTFPVDEYWLDIGRMNDFEKAQKDAQHLFS